MKRISLWTTIVLLCLSLVAVYSFVGCKAEKAPMEEETTQEEVTEKPPAEEEVTEEPPAEEQIKIGYSTMDMEQPYWQQYAKGIEDACTEAGYEFVLSDQKSSQETMVSGCLDLINQGISALIVSPIEPAALPAVIDTAHESDIPVIIGDVGVAGDYDAFVLSNNYDGGRMAAEYLVEQMGDKPGTKEVLIILLTPGVAVGGIRAAGFRDEIEKHSDFKIVAELVGDNNVEGGYKVTQDTLSSNPDLVGIYACHDPEAEGAAQALKAAGKDAVKDVLVIGFNADPPALDLIKSGEMGATIRQDPYGQGRTCLETAITLINGQSVEFSNEEEKTIYFPVMLIDASNVDQFIGD